MPLRRLSIPAVTGASAMIPLALAVMPTAMLATFWAMGETALIAWALGLPCVVCLAWLVAPSTQRMMVPRDSVTGLMLAHGFDEVLAQVFETTRAGDRKSACFLIELDDAEELAARHGQAIVDQIARAIADRLIGTLRAGDSVARLGDTRFGLCLEPVRQLDLELCLQIAGRCQGAIEEPLRAGGLTLYVSCSIGLCLRSRAPKGPAQAWLTAAQTALDEARQNGPSSIRVFSADMEQRRVSRRTLHQDVLRALDNGEVQAWFQPQLSTQTGRVSGFEALARWMHPVNGTIAPDQFLPALEEQGMMGRLCDVILHQSLDALRAWDHAGHDIPRISVNLSQQDLNDPRLFERIGWELDRYDLAPERLCVEILETVVSNAPDDVVVLNINALSALGCAIDLDDYGTGHASIAALKRFPVNRIKIDRSFVMKADQDPEQQRMIRAVLTMAESLRLDTLAEGVETVGEHAFLAQMGCDHVQGFGIGRPMPFEQTLVWLRQHEAKLTDLPRIGRQTG